MNRFEATIAVEAARYAIDQSQPPAKLPATVVSVAGTTATVLVDGAATPVPVTDLVGVTTTSGTSGTFVSSVRVMVEFRPSGAAYIVNRIS